MSVGTASRRLLAAGCALLLTGCAFSPQLQRVAVDHNRMVADAEDELTLLNIVRASRRFPLHFTAVTQVNGDAEVALSSSLAIGLEPGPDPTASGLGAEVATNPSFQASVLATDEFQRGIQSPIGSELIAYYLDEGWPDELIMALLIERLERADAPAERARSILNDEKSSSEFARILCTHELVSEPTTASRPLAKFEEIIDLPLLADPAKSADQRRKEIDSFLSLTRREGVRLRGDTLVLTGSSNSVRLVARKQSRCAGVSEDEGGAQYQLRFRSTLGVIYFLGEYLRHSEARGRTAAYTLPSCSEEECRAGNFEKRPLIAIDRGSGDALISTHFLGERYYISAQESGPASAESERARTMQVIAIVQQLVNLQKSADTLPRSFSITALN